MRLINVSYNISGALPKIVIDNKIIKGASNYGIEPVIEVLVSNLLDVLKIEHIKYTLDFSYKYNISGLGLVSICNIHNIKNKTSLFDYCMSFVNNDIRMLDNNKIINIILGLDKNILNKIFTMIHIDAIICNTDRHYNNIELVIKDNKPVDLFPLFDNGASLLHDNDITGLYSLDSSRTLSTTHKLQVEFIKRLGYSRKFGDTVEIYKKWLNKSENILLLINEEHRENIKNILRWRLKLYGNV